MCTVQNTHAPIQSHLYDVPEVTLHVCWQEAFAQGPELHRMVHLKHMLQIQKKLQVLIFTDEGILKLPKHLTFVIDLGSVACKTVLIMT